MFPQQHFRLTRQAVLLAMISAAYPATGYCAAAGRADFVVGNVVAVAADGSQRPLSRGAAVNVGDAISTAAGARVQLRFTDGGFVSLQPNTQFRVDTYQYEGKTDGKEKGIFSLLRGGLRAVTGAIGLVNRDSYRVATPTATIGIRGTGYNATLSDGLLVNVGEGAISLTNNAGTLVVTSGNAAFVADFNTLPALTFQKPSTPPAGFLTPVPDTTFSEAERRDAAGSLTVLPSILPILASGPGYALAFAGSVFDSYSFYGVLPDVSATFTATSQLTQYGDGYEGGALGTANVSFSATDGIIGWGRWNGGTTTGNIGDCCESNHPLDLANGDTFHYVVGVATPSADMMALYSNNVTATYSLLGGTLPTLDNGSSVVVGSLDSGSLTANFGTATVGVNLGITFPVAGSYAINATGSIYGSTFGASGAAIGGSCSTGCYTNIAGFFAGAGASRAGVAYSFNDAGYVSGVAAFAKSSSGPTID